MKNDRGISREELDTVVELLINEKNYRIALLIITVLWTGYSEKELQKLTKKDLCKTEPYINDECKNLTSRCQDYIDKLNEDELLFNMSSRHINRLLSDVRRCKMDIIIKSLTVYQLQRMYARVLRLYYIHAEGLNEWEAGKRIQNRFGFKHLNDVYNFLELKKPERPKKPPKPDKGTYVI